MGYAYTIFTYIIKTIYFPIVKTVKTCHFFEFLIVMVNFSVKNIPIIIFIWWSCKKCISFKIYLSALIELVKICKPIHPEQKFWCSTKDLLSRYNILYDFECNGWTSPWKWGLKTKTKKTTCSERWWWWLSRTKTNHPLVLAKYLTLRNCIVL